MVGDLSASKGARSTQAQALATGSNRAAGATDATTPSTPYQKNDGCFRSGLTARACSATPQRSPLKSSAQPSATPQKQTTLQFTPTKRKIDASMPASPGTRQNGRLLARAERSTAAAEQARCAAEAPKEGTPHSAARKVVHLISEDSSSSSEGSGGDVPGAQAESSPRTLAAQKFKPNSGNGIHVRKYLCDSEDDREQKGPASQPLQAEPRGSSSRIVVELLSSDEDDDVQQQDASARAPDGAPGPSNAHGSQQNEMGAGDDMLPSDDPAACSDPENSEHSDPDSGDDPMPEDGALFFQALVEEQTTNGSEQAKDCEMQNREAEPLDVQNSPPRTRCTRSQAFNPAVQSEHGDQPMCSEDVARGRGESLDELQGAQRHSDGTEAVALQNSGPLSSGAVATTARLCTSAPVRGIEGDYGHQRNGTQLNAMAQALSGDPSQLHQRNETVKGSGCKACQGKGAQIRRDKQKRAQKQKSSHVKPNYDRKGPMLFHHLARQPFTVGLEATEDLHRRIDREDKAAWQYWVTSLRQRMRQQSMSHEEAYYIFRFEHYRFSLPHSANALTQHCLKVLNGTVTPCPDYLFDHLRPADPNPPVENDEEEELAEAKRRKEEAAVARLAALQKAAAGSKAVVGLKRQRPAPYAGPSNAGPAFEDRWGEELELLLCSVPADQVSVRVKEELQKLDETLATQAVPLDPPPSDPKKQKVKLKIKRRPPAALPVLFRYVDPSEYPRVARRLVKDGRTRRLSDIDRD